MHRCLGLVLLRYKVFARLNNCANCDEADVSFVQTQKMQSLCCLMSQCVYDVSRFLCSICLFVLFGWFFKFYLQYCSIYWKICCKCYLQHMFLLFSIVYFFFCLPCLLCHILKIKEVMLYKSQCYVLCFKKQLKSWFIISFTHLLATILFWNHDQCSSQKKKRKEEPPPLHTHTHTHTPPPPLTHPHTHPPTHTHKSDIFVPLHFSQNNHFERRTCETGYYWIMLTWWIL